MQDLGKKENMEFNYIPVQFLYAFVFIFGASVGSFLNVCILRIPIEMSVVMKRSHCPKCNTILTSSDLIPLISYIMLLGKCRYCGERFSSRYFLIEFLTAVLFVAGAIYFPPQINLASFLVFIFFSSIMIVVIFIDIDHLIIPDRFSYGLMIAGILLAYFNYYPINAGQNQLDIDLSELSKGIYLVKTSVNGKSNVSKLIVR